MGAVMRSSLLLLTAVVALAACASGSEKQWTKPGGDYTTAEFQRDRVACTKDKVLDEDCLRQRGWISLSADADRGPSSVTPAGTKGGKYGY